MGASIAALCDGETVWCSAGRSPETRRRAAAAGMTEVGSLAEMAERVDLIGWSQKERFIRRDELEQAKADYEHARRTYQRLLSESEVE